MWVSVAEYIDLYTWKVSVLKYNALEQDRLIEMVWVQKYILHITE